MKHLGVKHFAVSIMAIFLLSFFVEASMQDPPKQTPLLTGQTLYEILPLTDYRIRPFTIGYSYDPSSWDYLGWENLARYNPFIGGWSRLMGPDARVDTYISHNPEGNMLGYENTLEIFNAASADLAAVARNEHSFFHSSNPARLRLLPGSGQVRIFFSDDGRTYLGNYAPHQTYIRGENVISEAPDDFLKSRLTLLYRFSRQDVAIYGSGSDLPKDLQNRAFPRRDSACEADD